MKVYRKIEPHCALCNRPGGDGAVTQLRALRIKGRHAHQICLARLRERLELRETLLKE